MTLGPFPTIYIRIPFIHYLSGMLIIVITTTIPSLNWPTTVVVWTVQLMTSFLVVDLPNSSFDYYYLQAIVILLPGFVL